MTALAPACCRDDFYLPQAATVVSTAPLTATEMLFRLQLESGEELGHMPGQFVEVTVPGVGEAPISVSSAPDRDAVFELIVRRAGRVTTALHQQRAGARLGIRGPFGTHYPVEGAMRGRDIVFIAGGIGLVPLRSAIQYVLDRRDHYGDVTILYGTRSPQDRLFTDELADWAQHPGIRFLETVDQAHGTWTGNVGVITKLIPQAGIDASKAVAAICGPPIMYKFVIVSLYALDFPDSNIWVSLERRMKCGVGKCGHCQVGGLYACMDGPVFNYADIVHVQEAI